MLTSLPLLLLLLLWLWRHESGDGVRFPLLSQSGLSEHQIGWFSDWLVPSFAQAAHNLP